jgi:Immunoglobulin-like domain of bacterial spore germination
MKKPAAVLLIGTVLSVASVIPAGAYPVRTGPVPAVWPSAPAPWRTAAQTALTFATRLGFGSPVLIRYLTTPTTATMTIAPRRGGPTTVITEQLRAGRWFVTGTAASTIRVADPTPGQWISGAVTVHGWAQGFEGQLRAFAMSGGVVVAQTVAHCGSTSLGPLTATMNVGSHPGAGIVLYVEERSARDGSTIAASVISTVGGAIT